ncbi:aldehyde dehydrogenase [Rhizobium etli]|uniref:aldehyde dehydrogenase n=1 Tax=Rhizobium etli TaxID=29449 RepID=UPI000383A3D1|nr:aldehyde dehydrogenase [Rhizobium etli]AGS25502.1 aldehyde dehydrogenase protein [Rhizobium etli bv. mimosae str. Mim1]
MSDVFRTKDFWHDAANSVRIPTRAFVDGKHVDPAGGKTFDAVNPATGKILAAVGAYDASDVDAAVRTARKAFSKGDWSRCDPAERGRVLTRLADLIMQHREELALLETMNMGKLITDSTKLDVPSAAAAFRWYGEAVDKLVDEVIPTGESRLAMVTREPVGVVGAVVPWNFPLKMAAWKCAPSLAAGNSVILKPAEQSPLSALRLAELAAEAGVPPGVFNVLPGLGTDAGRAIGLHPDIDCVAFTGSTEVGKMFLGYSSQSNMKRVWLECGGKSANIIFPAVADIGAAASAAALGIYFNQGEVCSATSRLYVHASIHDEFVDRLKGEISKFQPGDPLDPASGMGALVSEEHLERVSGYIDLGKKSATLVAGGDRALTDSGGYFMQPTIFTNVKPASTLSQDEIFGPVLAVTRFECEDEAVGYANDSIYGLGASVWTNDLSQAHRVARRLHAGSVSVNLVDNVDVRTPFGGVKQSGTGRDLSLHAFDKYTELKTTWVAL